ncbi:type II toxin-antitoxin system prevent-host-death family antitoxin [Mesorhizobium sp. RSR380A]
MDWHLRDARNNLSKLVRQAREEGPQTSPCAESQLPSCCLLMTMTN